MTRWPTDLDSQVCTTPIIAEAVAPTMAPTMAPTSHSSSVTSCWGSRVVDHPPEQEGLGQAEVVDALGLRGLVERAPDPDVRRAILVRPTEAARHRAGRGRPGAA